MQILKYQTGMHCPPPPDSLMRKSTKLPRVEGQTVPPPRVYLDKESKDIEQKTPSTIQINPPSAATREKKTNKLKELVKQCRHGHYTGNKYDLQQETHW